MKFTNNKYKSLEFDSKLFTLVLDAYINYLYTKVLYISNSTYNMDREDDNYLVMEGIGLKIESIRQSRSLKNSKRREIFRSLSKGGYKGVKMLRGKRHNLTYEDIKRGVLSLRVGSKEEEKDKIVLESKDLRKIRREIKDKYK